MTRPWPSLFLPFLLLSSLALAAGCDDGPAPASCKGEPISCPILTDEDCGLQLGCLRHAGDCTGVPTSCSSEFSSFSCESQPGCFWSSFSESCSGSAEPCELQIDEFTCSQVDGCFAGASTCTGTALKLIEE